MKFPCQMIEKLQFLLLMSTKERGTEMVVIPRVRKIMQGLETNHAYIAWKLG